MTRTEQELVAAAGYAALTRDSFFNSAIPFNPLNDAEANARELALLRERAANWEGAFVLYDPADDAEGFMLIGDDVDALWHAATERFDLG